MEYIEKRIEELRIKGYGLRANEVLSSSFNLLMKILFIGIFATLFSHTLLSLAIQACTNYLQIGNIDATLALAISKYYSPDKLNPIDYTNPASTQILFDEYVKYFTNPLVFFRFIIFIVTKILIYPLFAGVTYCAYKQDQTGATSFKDLITGFEGKRFINLIGLSSIYMIISILSLGFMYLPMLFFTPAFFLAGAFIVIDNVSIKKAIQYSFQVAKINFGQILLISLISFLLGTVLGTIFVKLYVFIFTTPLTLTMVYVVYKNTIGFIKTENIEK